MSKTLDNLLSPVIQGVFHGLDKPVAPAFTRSRRLCSNRGIPSSWTADFTPDGTRLVVGSDSGALTVFDVPALLSGVPLAEAVLLEILAHDTLIIIVSASPDGSMAFSSSRNEPLKLWSLESG